MNKPTRRKSSLGWGYEDIDCPQCEICNNRPQLSWCVLCETCEEHIYPLMKDFKKHFPEYYADIDNHSSVMDWMHGVDGKVIESILTTPNAYATLNHHQNQPLLLGI